MTSDEHDLAIETNDLVKIYSGNGFLKKNRVETWPWTANQYSK